MLIGFHSNTAPATILVETALTRLIAPVLSAFVLTATPVFGQDTLPIEQEAVPIETLPLGTEPLPAQPLESQPDMGLDLPAGPVLRETHGSWEVRCIGDSKCFMTQIHKGAPATADAVFTVAKVRSLSDEAGNVIDTVAEIAVPLGVFLPTGMGLKIDGGPAQMAPYERCVAEGCVVRVPISADMVQQLKQGSTVAIVIFGAPDQPVTLPISLIGFTAAYDSL